jgi:hypothetical protein
MASPGLSEIVTTTLRNRTKEMQDAYTHNTALLYRLNDRGNKRSISGGRTIVNEISYAENGTFQFYSGYDTLNVSPSDVFTAAEYNWKQAAVAVSWSGLETAEQRSGAGSRSARGAYQNAEGTMVDNLSTGLYSDGTGYAGKQIGGLQLIVSDSGLGTVGGISANTWSFWRNQVYSFATNGLVASSAPSRRR